MTTRDSPQPKHDATSVASAAVTERAVLVALAGGGGLFLAWMAVAEGSTRVLAAGLFALVHFMNQPVYNSLIANYTPRKWRSLCYGFSFMTSFGVGS